MTTETSAKTDACAGDQPKGRRAAGQDPSKRDQILDGADAVFSRVGFDAASMNDITREAGVSKSTIYVYFTSKEELFEALVTRQRDRLFSEIREQLEKPGPIEDVLFRYGFFLSRKLCSEYVVRAHRIVIGVTERRPDLGRRFYEGGARRGMQVLKAYLEAEIAKGTLQIDDTELAAYQFVELSFAGLFRRRLLADRATPPDEEEVTRVVRSAVELFLNTYGTGGSRRAR
jgi:AcrR family transcriptional regulator